MEVCMDDLQAWPQPDGNLTKEKESAAAANPMPSSIDGKIWGRAEESTSEIILCVQPHVKSVHKRSEVIYYVQPLIRSHIGCQVLYRFLDYFSKFDWDNYCVRAYSGL